MRALLLLVCLLSSGCATRVYENGLPVLATYSNASYLKFKSPKGTELEIHNLDNSGPTRAAANGIRDIGVAGGFGVLTGGAVP